VLEKPVSAFTFPYGIQEKTLILAELASCGSKQNEPTTQMSLLVTQSLCSWVSG
jgi:hypothetical protein